ncbi:histidine kinase [Galbitalea sp. SE-J8]|uniref:sensor histidine kinase n=1 Tax=Galbitalea sp. SE-J8 TaxID=3054952 RepID=UPI00259C7144|nr:histidine kinase [Galbitalea sp. SE-J8]MDM4761828.1 histidine kinase [Galbitalea sp. SE-J8]
MIRRLTPVQLAVDLSLAALCVLARFTFSVGEAGTLVAIVLMAAALGIRRLSPAIALGLVWVGALLQVVLNLPPDLSNAAIPAVLFTTARYGDRLLRWLGLASAIAGAVLASLSVTLGNILFLDGSLVAELPRAAFTFVVGFVVAATVFVLSWTFGLLWRTWALARESRAAQQAAVLQRERAEREVGVEQERVALARDMHDVVAHSLAVVIAQADGARYAMRADPNAADAALTTISATARDALADVRVLLAQLRHSQAAGPQPMLADLDRLIGQLRQAGLDIRHEVVGEPLAVGTGTQLAVYRIVQESLTNALRHGDAAKPVLVRLTWTGGSVVVAVESALRTDAVPGPGEAVPFGAGRSSAGLAPAAAPAGRAPAAPAGSAPAAQAGRAPAAHVGSAHAGHGIDGMRERAQLVGGVLTAGPHDGRFLVSATLPAAAPVPPLPPGAAPGPASGAGLRAAPGPASGAVPGAASGAASGAAPRAAAGPVPGAAPPAAPGAASVPVPGSAPLSDPGVAPGAAPTAASRLAPGAASRPASRPAPGAAS